MKATPAKPLWISLLLFLVQHSFAVTIYNSTGPASGVFPTIDWSQFFGARFNITTPMTLVSAGEEFENMSGSFFVAVVPLTSMTSVPMGNPGTGIPFNPGEVLAYQTFDAITGSTPQIITVPFSINLSPGIYGVVFGTGLFGTSGWGQSQAYGKLPSSSGFFWSSEPWRWQDCSVFPTGAPEEANIMITIVPEPSCTILIALGFSGPMLFRAASCRKRA